MTAKKKKKAKLMWYDESGLSDNWLRENDPLYGTSDAEYLTAREYRYRASEKEIPTDPDRLDRRF